MFHRMYLIFLLLFCSESFSGVYQCLVDGKTTFQSLPCTSGEQKIIKKNIYNDFGMHMSWFEKPMLLPEQARCTMTHCFCASQIWRYSSDIKQDLLNSMRQLRYAWDSHNDEVNGYSVKKLGFSNEIRQRIRKISCNISIKQLVIKKHFKEASEEISANYESASKVVKVLRKQCPKPSLQGWTQAQEARNWVQCITTNDRSLVKSRRIKKNQHHFFSKLVEESELLRRPRRK